MSGTKQAAWKRVMRKRCPAALVPIIAEAPPTEPPSRATAAVAPVIEVKLAGAVMRVSGIDNRSQLTAVAARGPGLGVQRMIGIPAGARILLAIRPVDFRKGAHSLAAFAEALAEDPFSGAVIVYRAKRSDRIKILIWDTSGLVLIWIGHQSWTA